MKTGTARITPILDRRAFLKGSVVVVGAGLATRLRPSAWAAPVGANEAVRIGIIGLHNKGRSHLRHLQELPGARVTALCDLDPQVLAPVIDGLKGRQITPFATTDARELLARRDVDAVIISTGNHWHPC